MEKLIGRLKEFTVLDSLKTMIIFNSLLVVLGLGARVVESTSKLPDLIALPFALSLLALSAMVVDKTK